MKLLLTLAAAAASAHAYWLMGIEDFITTERIDPIVNPGKVSGHVHSVLGGSNFRMDTNTSFLRQSECTSIPIPQDKSNYWFPHLYFQWNNGSFTSLNGGAVIYYLFSDTPGTTTAFPDNFRMLSGDPTLRTYNASSFAQQAITFLCLDFNGVSTKHNELPSGTCPSGIRAQINFPSCWDGKNVDSPDHKSHVSFLSTGPDSGSCSDPNFPVVLPRIFIEVYWASNDFDSVRDQAMNSTQPFVYSYGDPIGYGYHADFINGWDQGVLQRAVDNCHCNPYGDATCCVQQGLFEMNQGQNCYITKAVDEQTTGTLLKLPGNNPVQPEGKQAVMLPADSTPPLLAPIIAYTGSTPTATGSIVTPGETNAAGATSATHTAQPTTTAAPASSSVHSTSAVPPSSMRSSTPSTSSKSASTGLPSLSIPSTFIPSITVPAIPSITVPHVLSVNTAATAATSIVAPANKPTAIAAPANGASSSSSSPASSGSKTCRSNKKRRALEEERRGLEEHRRHVRRLAYAFDTI